VLSARHCSVYRSLYCIYRGVSDLVVFITGSDEYDEIIREFLLYPAHMTDGHNQAASTCCLISTSLLSPSSPPSTAVCDLVCVVCDLIQSACDKKASESALLHSEAYGKFCVLLDEMIAGVSVRVHAPAFNGRHQYPCHHGLMGLCLASSEARPS
jgi:hypothetical protein